MHLDVGTATSYIAYIVAFVVGHFLISRSDKESG